MLGGLCPPSQKLGGSGWQRPPAKNPFRNYRKTLRGPRVSRASWPLAGALARSKGPRSRRPKIFRRPRGHFERVFARELAVFALELAHLRAPGTPRTSILELETVVSSKFFYAANAPCAQRPTSTKPCKNQCETHFGASAHRSKFEAKSICQRFRFRLVTRTPSRASWELSLRLLERLWGCPGTHLDSSWPLFVHLGRP